MKQAPYSLLRTKVAAVLEKAGFWGSEADIIHRIQREAQNVSSGGDCSYRLSDDFDQSLLFLPVAIEYLSALPFSDLPRVKYENNRFWACHAVSSFLRTWHSALCDTSLIEPVLDSIQVMLDEWNRAFPPPRSGNGIDNDNSEEWTSRVDIPPAGVFLGFLLEAKVLYEDKLMFEYLFARWSGDQQVPASSANLLTLFLYVKCVGGQSPLYRNPLVLTSTFDKGLCGKHWQSAHALIEAQCPRPFVDALQEELL